MEDTNKELERLEKELLAVEDPLADQELFDLLKEEPTFDAPEDISAAADPVYRNYSNNYGQETETATVKDDKVVIGLLVTACALCLGILGVLVYWMEAFIR